MRIEYFQLIDRVTGFPSRRIEVRAEATIPTDSTIFEGHFPGYPLMPGVLLIEAMAQTCGWLIIARNGFARMPFLATVKEAKLRSFATPGQVLTIEGRLDHEGSGFAVAEANIRAADKLVCDADITFRLMPFDNPGFRSSMEQTAARLGLVVEAPVDG